MRAEAIELDAGREGVLLFQLTGDQRREQRERAIAQPSPDSPEFLELALVVFTCPRNGLFRAASQQRLDVGKGMFDRYRSVSQPLAEDHRVFEGERSDGNGRACEGEWC